MADFLREDYRVQASFRDRRLRYVSETTGLQTLSVESPAQRWELEVDLTVGKNRRIDSGYLHAHQALHGTRTPFWVEMPQLRGLPRIETGRVASVVSLIGGTGSRDYIDPDSIEVRAYGDRTVVTFDPPSDFVLETGRYQYRLGTTGAPRDGTNEPTIEVPTSPGTAITLQLRQIDGSVVSRWVQTVFTTPAAHAVPLIVLGGNAAAGDTVVQVQRLQGAANASVSRGTYIRFAGATKVHQVLRDVTVTSLPKSLTVYPAVTRDLATGNAVDLSPDILVRWAPSTPFEADFTPTERPTAYWNEAV